ncbi:MAG: hypothetical protein ABI415_06025 [Flavitalea sp.]
MSPFDFYSSKISQYSSRLKKIKRKSAIISVARLVSFLLFALTIYLYINNRSILLLSLLVLSLFLFITLIRVSASLSAKKNLTSKLLFINENEINVLDYKDNAFDDGASISNLSMHAIDLDIFGNKSVFHLLNRTTTAQGKDALAEILNIPQTHKEKIIAHQHAVSKLSSQPDIRQLMIANGLLQEKEIDTVEEIIRWIDTEDRMTGKPWLNIIRFVLPAIAVGGFFLYLSDNNPIPFGFGIVFNLIILGKFGKYTMTQHQLIGKKEAVLQQYGTILKIFGKSADDGSVLLKELKNTSASARQEILSLSKLSSLFDQRLNILVGIFLNWFLLYDIHVMLALESWKKKNNNYFRQWIKTVGEIEKINSLATFSFNHPHFYVPQLSDGKPFINAISMGHPLIPEGVQVTNDITAGENEQLLLITGSNMSGKSTFLRTIGVNVLFAQCGLPVCAKEFSLSPMHILSSIRISDSLQENTSYFMAELKRLKEIIDFLASGKPALVLIDEVLRGTNSEDKRYGSEELIKKLSAYNCLALFASHDLSLSALEDSYPGKVRNYCFESTITNGELKFDYQLHKGVATNKNASFLMQKMGIISTTTGS